MVGIHRIEPVMAGRVFSDQVFVQAPVGKHMVGMGPVVFFHLVSDTMLPLPQAVCFNPFFVQFSFFIKPFHGTYRIPFAGEAGFIHVFLHLFFREEFMFPFQRVKKNKVIKNGRNRHLLQIIFTHAGNSSGHLFRVFFLKA